MVGKFESNKDLVQELTSSGAQRVGKIATLVTGTVAEVAREIGEFVTDVIEMREAAAAARRDAAQDRAEADLAEAGDVETGTADLDAPATGDLDPAPVLAEPSDKA
ncbi:hypothetical protein AB0H20_29160 [Nocardia fluminea]|jgi:outer membrane murein-binding lipoprotein Lpp|uniref:hypothetical protein n=1 Tax=Nocardia fluminea TaxID=134984 RepID=UPI0033C826B6